MATQASKLRPLVREVRDAQKLKAVARCHLVSAEASANPESILAARQVVEFAVTSVTGATQKLLDYCDYGSLRSLARDINSLIGSVHESVALQQYQRGQREALEGILAYTEDELGEL